MVQLAKPTIENSATHQSFGGSVQTLPAPSATSSSMTVAVDQKPLPVLGNAPTAENPPVVAVQPQSTVSEAKPSATPAVQPQTTAEPALNAEANPAPAKTEVPAVQSASIATQPEPMAVTAEPTSKPAAEAPAPTPEVSAPSVATGAPAAEAPTTASVPAKAPVTTEPAAPVQAATPAPVNPPLSTASVTTPAQDAVTPAPAPAAIPSAPAATPAPASVPNPAVVTTPAIPTISQEMIAAALKTEVEADFGVGKPADEKKLTAEEKKSHAAVLAFYTARNFMPLWVDAKGLTHTAGDAMDRLAHAQEDGLNSADYPVPSISVDPTVEVLAKAEVEMTESTMKYARQAQAGRFDPSRLGELVTEKPQVPDPAVVLQTLSTSTNVSNTLEAYNPPHEGYKRLKEKLAEILGGKALVPQARVPDGPTIRPGAKDTRVALLRNRLGVTGGTTADDASTYDDSLVDAVKSFQKARGLKPSGLIGQQTVDAVNNDLPGANAKAADIIANMERWRWLARDLGELHVMVNVPDFSLTVVRDGVVTHKAKAIVGRVANPTPIFSETMTHIIVNPYWNVPYSIVKKEYLAKAQETNGEALERGNFEVEVGNKTVDPTTVDWTTVNASEVHLRQRPGAGNALGNIKFMFPNQHSVYIHDTSSRGLFVQDYRSLSHGCVRVQDPFSFADALLAEEPTGVTGAKLKSMIGGSEKYLWLKKTIPVHIAYFTNFVDDAGVLQTRPDLYGHNAKTKQILGL